jgi:leucyl-tRNA synthetase
MGTTWDIHESINFAKFPTFNPDYMREDSFEYPIMINGKMRTKISFKIDMSKEDIETAVMTDEVVIKWVDGQAPKKIIVVPKKIVNIVL